MFRIGNNNVLFIKPITPSNQYINTITYVPEITLANLDHSGCILSCNVTGPSNSISLYNYIWSVTPSIAFETRGNGSSIQIFFPEPLILQTITVRCTVTYYNQSNSAKETLSFTTF